MIQQAVSPEPTNCDMPEEIMTLACLIDHIPGLSLFGVHNNSPSPPCILFECEDSMRGIEGVLGIMGTVEDLRIRFKASDRAEVALWLTTVKEDGTRLSN